MKLKRRIKQIIIIALVCVITVILTISGFITYVYFGGYGHIYSKKELRAFKNELASQVLSADGVLIGKFYTKHRVRVRFDELPGHLVDALVATEDARYFEHEGVDSRSLLRVLIKSIILGDKTSGGGSTISQQLAKNMFGREDFGRMTLLVNKTKEIILASRLEEIYSKQEILARYLNTVPFGEELYGIEAASKRFFNESAGELNIEEAATLIGMLKANTYYNPRLNPAHSVERRNVVLTQMHRYGYLSESKKDSLSELPLQLNYANLTAEGPANYFLVDVQSEARKLLKDFNAEHDADLNLEKSGLVITTTLNHSLQLNMLESMKEHLAEMQRLLRRRYRTGRPGDVLDSLAKREMIRLNLGQRGGDLVQTEIFDWSESGLDTVTVLDSLKSVLTILHAGMLALDPRSGAVMGYVGGIDFRTQPFDQVKARRQMASLFKPVIYAAAIEDGMGPCDYLDNRPFELTDYHGWSPENYNHESGGKYALRAALAQSKNIPTARLFFRLGYERVYDMWRKLGFEDSLPNKPSASLGVAESSIYRVASAYAAFANSGHPVRPYTISKIATKDGAVIYLRKEEDKPERIIRQRTLEIMRGMLGEVIERGTAAAIRNKYGLKLPLAGKTGTSQDYADAWFMAFNPSMIMVARAGANLPSVHFGYGTHGSGSSLALPLVAKTLVKSVKNNTLRSELSTPFPRYEVIEPDIFECDDYQEYKMLEKLFDLFRNKETTFQKERKRAKRKRFF